MKMDGGRIIPSGTGYAPRPERLERDWKMKRVIAVRRDALLNVMDGLKIPSNNLIEN